MTDRIDTAALRRAWGETTQGEVRSVLGTGGVQERFWSKVRIGAPDECWEWLAGFGSKTGTYGRFSVNGKVRPATQVAWEIDNCSPFPSGKFACHSCDNPKCVNPSHIWPGGPRENAKDCVAKGRHRSKPKTHCQRGHEMTPENRKRRNWDGYYYCLQCERMNRAKRQKRWRERRARTALGDPS